MSRRQRTQTSLHCGVFLFLFCSGKLQKCVWYSGFHALTIPQRSLTLASEAKLIHHFLPFSQALFSSSTLHFMPFWPPCSAAACFASCGPSVPTTRPSMTESCHQVRKKRPVQLSLHLRLPPACRLCSSLSTVDCLCVSTGRYDDGAAPGGPRDRLQRLRSQILEEVREVDG